MFGGRKHSCGWSKVYRHYGTTLIDPRQLCQVIDYIQIHERIQPDLEYTKVQHCLKFFQCIGESLKGAGHHAAMIFV